VRCCGTAIRLILVQRTRGNLESVYFRAASIHPRSVTVADPGGRGGPRFCDQGEHKKEIRGMQERHDGRIRGPLFHHRWSENYRQGSIPGGLGGV